MNVEVNFSRWNFVASKFVSALSIQARDVVHKEAGELIKTLVKITPPNDVKKTRDNIASRAASRFGYAEFSGDSTESIGGRAGQWMSSALDGSSPVQSKDGGSVLWYGVTSQHLFGITKDKDASNASVSELKKIYYTLTKSGKQSLPFLKRKGGRQSVILSQNVLTNPKTVAKLITSLKANVGRLKSGWLTATRDGVIVLSGGRMPPKFVTKHLGPKTKGRYINELNVPGRPSFTIGNSGAGINDKSIPPLIQRAVNIRTHAMITNLRMILSGKKYFSDYAT